jgi:hypothetical protein
VIDLGEHIRQRAEAWRRATPAQRAACREAYIAAGWKTCPHPTCPPFDCEGK